MALQGDLNSFALSDVLHLLEGTAKTGRLAVTSTAAEGEVWFTDGALVSGSVSTGRRSEGPAEVVMEMLRFDDGSFSFDECDEGAPGDGHPVADVLRDAEALATEWQAVEAVVPSLAAWLTLRPAIDADEVIVSGDHWRALAAIAGGATVEQLADRCELSDLAASRTAKELTEAAMIEVGLPMSSDDAAPAGDAPVAMDIVDHPTAGVDEGGPVATDWAGPADDLVLLHGDDTPVVLDDGDGRMLPEPLLDEGEPTGVQADEVGSVDGRSVESIEQEAAEMAAAGSLEDPWAAQDDDTTANDANSDDEERGSLLRFLSTVEP